MSYTEVDVRYSTPSIIIEPAKQWYIVKRKIYFEKYFFMQMVFKFCWNSLREEPWHP